MLAAWARDRTKFREIERRVSDYLPTVLEQARQEAPEAIAMLRRFEDLWGHCQGPSPASFDRADDFGQRAVRRSRERLRGRLGSGHRRPYGSPRCHQKMAADAEAGQPLAGRPQAHSWLSEQR